VHRICSRSKETLQLKKGFDFLRNMEGCLFDKGIFLSAYMSGNVSGGIPIRCVMLWTNSLK